MRRNFDNKDWRIIKLKNMVFFQRGFDITKAEQQQGPYPVISSSGIRSYHIEYKVRGPGVIIGRKGSLGTIHFSKSDYWPHDTTLWSKSFKGNDPRFVYYALHLIPLKNYDVGGANPSLNRNHIHEIDIRIPTKDIQKKISSILSAYDDLIENNQRRIQLIEWAARLLYKEWFVHLHFPDHEHVKIRGGVPEGWKKIRLGDKILLKYGKALKAIDRVDGEYPVYGSSGIVGSHVKPLVQGPGIIVGRKGNVGSVFWSAKEFFPIDTVYYIDSESCNYYLYNSLQSFKFVSSDAAVPGLNRNYAHSLPYLMPSKRVHSLFEKAVAPMYEQIEKLEEYNSKLKQARDILLPRLMNGEISV